VVAQGVFRKIPGRNPRMVFNEKSYPFVMYSTIGGWAEPYDPGFRQAIRAVFQLSEPSNRYSLGRALQIMFGPA
jgi:hypothetical protein